MKCWICGAEMVNTIGGCYECRNCHQAGVDDLVLRTIIPVKPDEDKISPDYINQKFKPASPDKLIFKELNKFIENYRTELFSQTITPELSAVSARDADLRIFNELVNDFRDALVAIIDGPPCEGWTKGSDCRTCNMTECNSNRVHQKI